MGSTMNPASERSPTNQGGSGSIFFGLSVGSLTKPPAFSPTSPALSLSFVTLVSLMDSKGRGPPNRVGAYEAFFETFVLAMAEAKSIPSSLSESGSGTIS